MNRRELIQKLGGALAVAGVVAVTTKEKALAQDGNCTTEHYDHTESGYFYSQCSQQTIYYTITIKEMVQTCTNADGSVTYKVHDVVHGTAQSYNPVTQQFTGTQYVINEQVFDRQVVGPYTPGGCTPISDTERAHLIVVSKGSAPNEQVVLTSTFSVDSSCHYHSSFNLDTDCHG